MDNHHKFVGFIFAIMGGILVDYGGYTVFNFNQVDNSTHKLYWCCVFIIILGLIQLITSAFLTVKESFLKIWSFIHFGLALGYIIMFIILIVKIDDGFGAAKIYDPLLCHSFLIIIPVAAFNLAFKSRD